MSTVEEAVRVMSVLAGLGDEVVVKVGNGDDHHKESNGDSRHGEKSDVPDMAYMELQKELDRKDQALQEMDAEIQVYKQEVSDANEMVKQLQAAADVIKEERDEWRIKYRDLSDDVELNLKTEHQMYSDGIAEHEEMKEKHQALEEEMKEMTLQRDEWREKCQQLESKPGQVDPELYIEIGMHKKSLDEAQIKILEQEKEITKLKSKLERKGSKKSGDAPSITIVQGESAWQCPKHFRVKRYQSVATLHALPKDEKQEIQIFWILYYEGATFREDLVEYLRKHEMWGERGWRKKVELVRDQVSDCIKLLVKAGVIDYDQNTHYASVTQRFGNFLDQ